MLPAVVIPVGANDWVANCTILWLTVNIGCWVVKFLIINKSLYTVVLLLLAILKYVELPDFIKN